MFTRTKFFIVLILGLLCLPCVALAQSDTSNEALSISPFIIERRLDPGQTLHESIKLQNRSSSDLTIDITANDFMAENGSGIPIILPETQRLASNFALASWIQLAPSQHLQLGAGKMAEIKYSITPPPLAEPGSHYAAILVAYHGKGGEAGTTSITKKVGALIFLKLGRADERGAIGEFRIDYSVWASPAVNFSTKFYNTGNVHLAPKGMISVKNIFGGLAAAVPVNRDAAIVLPQTFRNFSGPWHPRFAFGRYTAELHYYYGDNHLEAVSKISFWLFPLWQIIGLVVLLALIILGGRWGIKRYNDWIIKKAK